MFHGHSLSDLRQVFFDSWRKFKANQVLSHLEQQIAEVIREHPEFHSIFEKAAVDQSPYFPELGQTNPFLHLGLHLSVREHVATNRPFGIADIYSLLLAKHLDKLSVEHLMMECLAETLWQAQRSSSAPDELLYLNALRGLVDES